MLQADGAEHALVGTCVGKYVHDAVIGREGARLKDVAGATSLPLLPNSKPLIKR